MFCCKKAPKERVEISPPITGASNHAYVSDGSETLNVNSFSPAFEVELPTRKPITGNKSDVPLRQDAQPEQPQRKPELGPKPNLPARNPNAQVLPGVQRKAEPPTAVVQPSISEQGNKKPAVTLEDVAATDNFAEIREAIALRDYESTETDMLSFNKGDLLEVVVLGKKMWWDGRRKSSGELGMVNASHISLKPSSIKDKLKNSKKEDTIVVRSSVISSSSTGPDRPWFKGTISRKQAEKLLMTDKAKKGTFLVREDENPLVFILGVRGEGDNVFINYEIKKTKDNQFLIFSDDKFDSIDDLVKFYTENKGGLVSELTKPCGTPDEDANEVKKEILSDEGGEGTDERQEAKKTDEMDTGDTEAVDNETDNNEVDDKDVRTYQTTTGRLASIHDYDLGSAKTDSFIHKEDYVEGISAAVEVQVTEVTEETTELHEQEDYEELFTDCSDCKTVEVLFDYKASDRDELSLIAGETLHVADYDLYLLNEARQLRCQHTFCRACIEPWLESNSVCPECRDPTRQRDMCEPRIVNAMLEGAQFTCQGASCPFQANGLTIRQHEDGCGLIETECKYGCQFSGARSDVQQHEGLCENKPAKCDICGLDDQPVSHRRLCKTTCLFCDVTTTRMKVTSHMLECKGRPVQCPASGCYKVTVISDMGQHLIQASDSHIKMIFPNFFE